MARLRRFRLAGSERAVREPRRCGLVCCCEALGEQVLSARSSPGQAFSAAERKMSRQMLRQGLNSPWTSSAGRLFDAVASLIGVRQISRYEGQAAMELEWLAAESESDGEIYAFECSATTLPAELDWTPMVRGILTDVARRRSRRRWRGSSQHAGRDDCPGCRQQPGLPVALSGGCFQNRLSDGVDGGAAGSRGREGILAPEGSSE